MTIRTRLTLWLGGILLCSLAVMAGVLHYEWVEQQRVKEQKKPPESAWGETAEIVVSYGVPTMFFLLVGSWWLLRKSLEPVTALTQAAERIHVNNLKEHLNQTGTGDELDRLTQVFNSMMIRLDESVANIREFTLNASHELKTPLTIMRAEMETALREMELSAPQRDTFANLLDEVARLTHIVDSLSWLAKADAGRLPFASEPVRLDELVQDMVTDARLLAQSSGVEVELNICEQTVVLGDRHRLKQLLLTLVDNAIKYNRPSGRIVVALNCKSGLAELTIANTGEGIPPEKLPRVFDRFYRGDLSHKRTVEGSGLGLSIAQWIVKTHGGSICIDSKVDDLTTVTVGLREAPKPITV